MIERYKPKLEPLDPNAFYTAKYLARRWGIHGVTIYKWLARGVLPAPTKLGPNTVRWPGSVIVAFEHRRQEGDR